MLDPNAATTDEAEQRSKLNDAVCRRFLTAELSDEEAAQIASSRMDARRDHLNALLVPETTWD